jgi:hypothetical protein
MRSTAAAPALLVLALLVGVSGCSDPSTDNADPAIAPGPSRTPITGTPKPSSTASPRESASPFLADTSADDGGQGSGNGLGVTGVRVAHHPGFDRVVFDLGGTGTPGWRVEYTTRPRYDGSGDPVRPKGTVYLQVILRGMGYPDDIGIAPYGDSTTRLPGTGTRGIAEIVPGGVFEGDQQAFIGLTGAKRPFRAFALANPARVVVDVRGS